MKKFNLLLGIMILLLNSAYAESRITIFYPDKESVILKNVLTLDGLVVDNPALKGNIWWPGAVIAEQNATQRQQQKQQQLLARLAALSSVLRQRNDTSLAATVDSVRSQLAELSVVGRQLVPLDPDVIRLNPEFDRRLSGDYQLYIVAEPHKVRLFGALAPHGKRDFLPGKDVSEYLAGFQLLDGAERNIAWIITPQGEVQSVPIAYWNQRHHELTPGSLLFLGIAVSALPDDFTDINEQVISLLTHRIPD
ncbi:hypothetical protein SRDD_11490 [Serratia sp. DD3]|nr:hypothetical protein SRDD_11490 [Serratia sp. DD3]